MAETNLNYVASEVYLKLQKDPPQNMVLLHFDRVVGRRGDAVDAQGIMMPGLRTGERNKGEMITRVGDLLRNRRIHAHDQLVTYATRDLDMEQDLLDAVDGDVPTLRARYAPDAPRGATKPQIFELAARRRLRAAFFHQLINMSRVEAPSSRRNLMQTPRYRFTGKIGRDEKDDLFMALGVGQIASHRHLTGIQPGGSGGSRTAAWR